jgi:hypothetical protein
LQEDEKMATARKVELLELIEDNGTIKLCTLEGQVIVEFKAKESSPEPAKEEPKDKIVRPAAR